MGAKINLSVFVAGQEQLIILSNQLEKLQKRTEQMNLVQSKTTLMYAKETEQLKQQNKINEATANIHEIALKNRAIELNKEEDFKAMYEQRMTVQRRALRLQEEASSKGRILSDEDARIQAQTAIAFEANEERKTMALRQTRRAIMQASISLFVLNISANQMISALKPLVKGNEEYTKTLDQMSATLNLTLGPMQLFMSLQQISINLSKENALAVRGLLTSMGALYFIYAMITTKSKELKIIMGALAGVFAVLAIKQMFSAKATWIQAGGMATLRAIAQDYKSLGILIAGGAITGALVGAMMGLQTLPGRSKSVKSSQMAYIHSGEEVRRPILADRMNSGGDTYHLHFDRGTSRSDASYIAQTVRDAINTGSIRKNKRAPSMSGA